MATKIGVREFRDHASNVLNRVERGETFEVCKHNRVVARLLPAEDRDMAKEWEEWFQRSEELSKEISAKIQGPVDAVEMIREQRRRPIYGD